MLRDYLQINGIHYGMLLKEIPLNQLKTDIRNEYPQINWVSIYLEGTTLQIDIKENDNVIVETVRGLELATAVTPIKEVEDSEVQYELKDIIRVADTKDVKQHIENLEKDIEFSNNIIKYSGFGFGEQRPDKKTSAAIKTWPSHANDAEDFAVKNNIFDRSRYCLINLLAFKSEWIPKYENNLIIQTYSDNSNLEENIKEKIKLFLDTDIIKLASQMASHTNNVEFIFICLSKIATNKERLSQSDFFPKKVLHKSVKSEDSVFLPYSFSCTNCKIF